MAVAIFALVSCSPKASNETQITGTFEIEAPETVTISLPFADMDTTVAVVDGKFAVTVPASIIEQATIKAGNLKVPFLSDGTPLQMTFKEKNVLEIVSAKPEISVQTRYTEFDKSMKELSNVARAKLDSLEENDTEAANAIVEQYQEDYMALSMEVLNANKDNFLAVNILRGIQYDLEDSQLDSLLATFDPVLDSVPVIVNIKSVLESKVATAEGKMFRDFEFGGKKLSDFVGKGKYMLVDFWASWCGPCKREIPNIKNVYEKYNGEDFVVLSVAVWDNARATVDTAKAYGVNWNEMVGNNEKKATDLYGIQGISHIILFGPDGTIIKRGLRGEAIEEEIAKYVKPKK